jgi:hypothetical protein
MRFYKADLKKYYNWLSYREKKYSFSDCLRLAGEHEWQIFGNLEQEFDLMSHQAPLPNIVIYCTVTSGPGG